MSSNQPNGGGRAGVDAAINQMVTSGPAYISGSQAVPVRVQGDAGDIQITTVPGEATQVEVKRAPTPGINDGRVADNGVDIQVAAETLRSTISTLQEQLTATSGFDQQTGQPIPALPLGSRERANTELQLAQLKRTASHQIDQWSKLSQQRAADQAEATRRAEVARFVAGDPAKAAAVKAELDRRGAAALVDQLFGPKR